MSNALRQTDPDFRLLFESAPGLYLALSPDLRILAVTDAYLHATMTRREDILGRGLFDVFPDNPDDPNTTGTRHLKASLANVLRTRKPDTMAVQKYDIRKPDAEGGGFEERYWSPVNSPAIGPTGTLCYIIHRVEDVTDYIRLKRQDTEQSKIADELKTRTGQMEAEIYRSGQELRKAREVALESVRLKSEFLANMSHEIRTPLNAIIGMAELLAETPLSSTQKGYAEIIQNSGDSLLGVINDILDFSKIEAGRIDIEQCDFDLHMLVAKQIQLLKTKTEEKGLSIAALIDPSIPTILRGDPLRVGQILLNLLSNAVKFTDRGSITVEVTPVELAPALICRFSVRDTGIGVPDSARECLFRPFTQADGSMARKYGGTGLGLSISKRLTEIMGGEIGLESTEGQGTTFWFTLQFTRADEPQRNESKHEVLAHERSLHILLVEDHPVNQLLTQTIIEGLGYRVTVTNNGRQAIEAIERVEFDLIFMDCQMPEMDGYETTRLIRTREPRLGGRTPIIALTANAMREDEKKCLECGMDGYLSKPFTREALQMKITAALQLTGRRAT